ncbi:MAG: Xaa-Pro peptidase family protein [bacterium]|nr:Xaa-Pro peptidase family protein [bacterium]
MVRPASKLEKPKEQDPSREQKRLKWLQSKLDKTSLDGFLVSKTENKTYLTGWEADPESGYLLITPGQAFLFTDSRYTEQAIQLVDGFEVVEVPGNFSSFAVEFISKKKLKRIAFESHNLSVFDFKRFKKLFPSKLIPLAHLLEERRATKDQDEIEAIRAAVRLDQSAFEYILNFVKTGQTEAEVAWELERKLKELGAQRMGWQPFIVASGANSSIPHYGNSSKVKIKKGDLLQLDFASVVEGYHSDTSRVIFIGKPDEEKIKIYNWVREAQELGESLVRPGKSGEEIDTAVRNFLKEKTPNYFQHGLGHGVGLEIHELPKLSLAGKKKLEIGNCFTVEPGIYRPGWGGVRLEDIVVLGKNGAEILTKTTKEIKDVTI